MNNFFKVSFSGCWFLSGWHTHICREAWKTDFWVLVHISENILNLSSLLIDSLAEIELSLRLLLLCLLLSSVTKVKFYQFHSNIFVSIPFSLEALRLFSSFLAFLILGDCESFFLLLSAVVVRLFTYILLYETDLLLFISFFFISQDISSVSIYHHFITYNLTKILFLFWWLSNIVFEYILNIFVYFLIFEFFFSNDGCFFWICFSVIFLLFCYVL